MPFPPTSVFLPVFLHRAFATCIVKLKKLIIRHTKAQRIGGAVALALPTLASETEWLTFSDAEKVVYDKALFESQQEAHKSRSRGNKIFSISMQLSRTMQACAGVYDGWSTFDLSQPHKDGDEVIKRSTTRATGMEKLTYARGKESRKSNEASIAYVRRRGTRRGRRIVVQIVVCCDPNTSVFLFVVISLSPLLPGPFSFSPSYVYPLTCTSATGTTNFPASR